MNVIADIREYIFLIRCRMWMKKRLVMIETRDEKGRLILQLTAGKNVIIPLDDNDQSMERYVDVPGDKLPGEDEARDRDHFPDDVPEAEIDQLLESMNTPYWIKYGRPEEIQEDDPDIDPDEDPEDE